MPTIGMSVDMSALVNATVAENSQETITVARNLLRSGAPAAELAGRAGLIAAAGDSDGHAIVTLSAAAALSRWMMAVPRLPEQDPCIATMRCMLNGFSSAFMEQARTIARWKCAPMMVFQRRSRMQDTL